jgi:hypothetical protein
MTVTYTKTNPNQLFDCYKIYFSFEHGDADADTYSEKILAVNEDTLVGYVKKVEEISDQIDRSCSSGKDLPKTFEEDCVFEGIVIPVERDVIYNTVPNYFANMLIDEIRFYDHDGVEYIVDITS